MLGRGTLVAALKRTPRISTP